LPAVPTPGTLEPIMGLLLEALFPATRRQLLVLLFREPDRSFYLRQIIRQLNLGQGGVQRELANLVQAGLVTKTQLHGRSFYAANRDSPVFDEMAALIHKTEGLLPLLRQSLSSLGQVLFAFVYGSVAERRERPDSDVDLAVVGPITFLDVVKATRPIQCSVGRDINPIVFTATDLKQRWQSKDHFITCLLLGAKEFVKGTLDDIEAVVGEPLADTIPNE